MGDPTPILAALDRAGHRLTPTRRAVARLIAGQPGPFSAADLLAAAATNGDDVGRATLFRTIDLLLELAMVERIELPSGEHAYVACEQAHHHHLVCSRCGRAIRIDDTGLRSFIHDVIRRTGYRVYEHRLELFGLCPTCVAVEPGLTRIPA